MTILGPILAIARPSYDANALLLVRSNFKTTLLLTLQFSYFFALAFAFVDMLKMASRWPCTPAAVAARILVRATDTCISRPKIVLVFACVVLFLALPVP